MLIRPSESASCECYRIKFRIQYGSGDAQQFDSVT
ncbi:hypothetical protein SBV1_3130005 [Verrucomicrobia bacterium]|nr:hypothetical protein SBV1_3130005 [Verrucomicrobiota bacterium]